MLNIRIEENAKAVFLNEYNGKVGYLLVEASSQSTIIQQVVQLKDYGADRPYLKETSGKSLYLNGSGSLFGEFDCPVYKPSETTWVNPGGWLVQNVLYTNLHRFSRPEWVGVLTFRNDDVRWHKTREYVEGNGKYKWTYLFQPKTRKQREIRTRVSDGTILNEYTFTESDYLGYVIINQYKGRTRVDASQAFSQILGRMDWFHHALSKAELQPCFALKRALDATKALDINTIAYGNDIVRVVDLAKSLTTFDKKAIIKSGANLYLSGKYGLSNLIRDTEELASSLTSFLETNTVATTRGAVSGEILVGGLKWRVTSRTKLVYEGLNTEYKNFAYEMKRAIRKNFVYDLVTFENIWDFVPLSFVIDWFVPYGEMFKRMDSNNYLNTLPVIGTTSSTTYSTTGSFAELMLGEPFLLNVVGEGTVSIYERYALPYAERIPLTVNHSQKGFSGHWLEATALTIQRL